GVGVTTSRIAGNGRAGVEDSAAAPGKVVHAAARSVVGNAPLHAELLGAVVGHFGNDRLDQHLGAADIQLADNLRHFPGQLSRPVDDHRVGTVVGLDTHPGILVAVAVGTGGSTTAGGG